MRFTTLVLCLILFSCSRAQEISADSFLTAKIYSEVKQAGQFIDRFNMKDTVFPSNGLTPSRFINILSLMNMRNNLSFSDSSVLNFATDAAQPACRVQVDDSNWLATITAVFTQKGEEKNVGITLKYCKGKNGDKWVIVAVDAHTLAGMPHKGNGSIDPLNNELDFMELAKTFKYHKSVVAFADSSFAISDMSVFFYMIESGSLAFNRLENITYHVLTVPGWLFRVNYYNRMDLNSGWLISSILRATEQDKYEYKKHLLNIH